MASYSVVPFKKFTDAEKESPWSFSGDDGNALLGEGENKDWAAFKSVHLIVDTEEGTTPEVKSAYGFPHHKKVDGTIKTFFRGVVAAGLRLTQNQEKYKSVLSSARSHLGKHYKEFDAVPPWEKDSDSMYAIRFISGDNYIPILPVGSIDNCKLSFRLVDVLDVLGLIDKDQVQATKIYIAENLACLDADMDYEEYSLAVDEFGVPKFSGALPVLITERVQVLNVHQPHEESSESGVSEEDQITNDEVSCMPNEKEKEVEVESAEVLDNQESPEAVTEETDTTSGAQDNEVTEDVVDRLGKALDGFLDKFVGAIEASVEKISTKQEEETVQKEDAISEEPIEDSKTEPTNDEQEGQEEPKTPEDPEIVTDSESTNETLDEDSVEDKVAKLQEGVAQLCAMVSVKLSDVEETEEVLIDAFKERDAMELLSETVQALKDLSAKTEDSAEEESKSEEEKESEIESDRNNIPSTQPPILKANGAAVFKKALRKSVK